jgi:ESCRT-II complex subunit VPS36
MKISFRQGGFVEALQELNKSLDEKDWLKTNESSDRIIGMGICTFLLIPAGIVKNIEISNKKNEDALESSFQDLNALMNQAAEMAKLAASIKQKLSSSNDKNNELFQQQLLDIGIIDPVTKQSSGTEYHKELAKELSEFLTKLQSKTNTDVFSLSDVYCLFNRARGICIFIY